jgi:hypothetical protein
VEKGSGMLEHERDHECRARARARALGPLGILLVSLLSMLARERPAYPIFVSWGPLPKDPQHTLGVDEATRRSEVFGVTASIRSMIHARIRARAHSYRSSDRAYVPSSGPGFRIGLAAVDTSTTHESFRTFGRNRRPVEL